MFMTDEEILAKNYGFWGNTYRQFMYESRRPDWELMQDGGVLDSYLTKMNHELQQKERKMLNKALLRSGMIKAIQTRDASEWLSRCEHIREKTRAFLLKEIGY